MYFFLFATYSGFTMFIYHNFFIVFVKKFVSEWLQFQPRGLLITAKWQTPVGFITRGRVRCGDGSLAQQQTIRKRTQVSSQTTKTNHIIVFTHYISRPGYTCACSQFTHYSMCKHVRQLITKVCPNVCCLKSCRPPARWLVLVLWVTK